MLGYGPSGEEPRISSFNYRNLPLWDVSNRPSTNDRLAKLGGSGAVSRGLAIADFNPETNEIEVASGFGRSGFSMGRFEPDNWVFLDHGGLDKVWASRWIADHENTSGSRKHRSGIVVNQKETMLWAYTQDQWAVVKIKDLAPPIPKGREFNGAGFLSSLFGGSTGGFTGTGSSGIVPLAQPGKSSKSGAAFIFPKQERAGSKFTPVETESNQGPKRATLTFNTNQRGGYFSDLKGIAQTPQLFHMMPINPGELDKAPVSSAKHGNKNYGSALAEAKRKKADSDSRQQRGLGSGGGTGGATWYEKVFGQVFNDPDERGYLLDGDREKRDKAPTQEAEATEESGGPDGDGEVERQMAALRGDVIFDMDGRPAHLAMQYMIAAIGDDAYRGGLWLYEPNPLPPHYLPADDKSSDQPKFERPPQMPGQYGIRPWVKIPKNTGVPPGCQVQPHFDPAGDSYGTTGVLPSWSTGTGADAGMYRPPLPLVDRAMATYDFPSGFITGIGGGFVIPSTRMDIRHTVEVPYVLPSNLAGAEVMEFRLFWKVVSGFGQTAGETWNELTAHLTAGDNPATAHQVKCLKFEIPPLYLSRMGGGGGRLHYRFVRRSDDSATGKSFRLVGNIQSSFSPVHSSRARTYGGAA